MSGVFNLGRLSAKASATFDAAALEDGAAGFGGVAFHKAVFGFTLVFVGLICSFGHNDILS